MEAPESPMNAEQLVSTARDVGFSDLSSIQPLVRGAVVLTPDGQRHERSRFGGRPELPASLGWPQWGGKSLSFIGQIDLAGQPEVLAQEGFPRVGLLLFFYDAEQSTFGFEPKDAGSFPVIYVPDSGELITPHWPDDLPEVARYTACALPSEETISLPPSESVVIQDLHLEQEQLDAYHDLVGQLTDDEVWSRRGLLGGYPDQIQGDMMLQCALVSAGLDSGDSRAYKDPRLPWFREEARNWRLLLQVPSVEEAGMMWGDVGCLYYWIHDEDLSARRFDRSWMILQSG